MGAPPPGEAHVAAVLVVILNYNGIADTIACLDSLRAQTCRDFAVLVIDNASRNDDLGLIGQRFPDVEVIALTENRGWAGGNNVGLHRALERGFRFVCLLNNDTVLDARALAEMLDAAERIGAPCLMHPAIFYHDEPLRPQLWPLPPERADPAMQRLLVNHDIVEMNYAYGACLLLPTTILRTVGLLDERFFLQLEEQDFYRRAVATGVVSYCARRARILHKESVSFGGAATPAKVYYLTRNSLLLAEKHDATPRGILRAVYFLLGSLQNRARSAGVALPGWPGLLRWLVSADPMARAAREGVGDYMRRRFGPRRPAGQSRA